MMLQLENGCVTKSKLCLCTFIIMIRWPREITFDLNILHITVIKEAQWLKKWHLTKKKKESFGCKRNKFSSRCKRNAIINPSVQLLWKDAVYGFIVKNLWSIRHLILILISYHTISYIISYNIYHIIYNTISYHMSYQIKSYHIIIYNISYHIT